MTWKCLTLMHGIQMEGNAKNSYFFVLNLFVQSFHAFRLYLIEIYSIEDHSNIKEISLSAFELHLKYSRTCTQRSLWDPKIVAVADSRSRYQR